MLTNKAIDDNAWREGIRLKITCLICGRAIEIEEFKPDPYDDDEDDLEIKKKVSFCQMCEAKIRNESDKNQKVPKPM